MAVKTDQRIVRAMAELLRVQGYTATGLQQLARAAGAPIGSNLRLNLLDVTRSVDNS